MSCHTMTARVLALLLPIVLLAGTAGADQRDPRLDTLFGQLQRAEGEAEAEFLQQQIWRIWIETESPTVELLMKRGSRAIEGGDFAVALKAFGTIVELAPQYAEGWNKRATLFYMMGRYEESIEDVERTLDLEPRHFGALSGLGMIYLQLDKEADALDAYQRTLEVNPHSEMAREQIKRLGRKVGGERI